MITIPKKNNYNYSTWLTFAPLFIFMLLLILPGCAKWQGYIGMDPDLQAEANIAVDTLIATSTKLVNNNDVIIVTSLADINNLESSNSFGRTFSELIISSLTQRMFKVQELRIRESIFVAPGKGEFLLSRKPSALAKDLKAKAIIVGTYTTGKYTFVVNIKLIDAIDNKILSSYDVVLPIGSELKSMLSQW